MSVCFFLREILTLTGRTNTVKSASKRYFMTGKNIHLFYTTLPWTEEGQKVFNIVNNYHLQAALSSRTLSRHERHERASGALENLKPEEKLPCHPLDQVLFDNLALLKDTQFKDRKFELYNR